ncbi:ubiquinol-cytochrome C reductase [Erwinia sp. INIA-01]|uniref:ubiquinol-cytochrome C reductase n=1 Tax=Erwiniaceae TaxID=1903409 RepID=UPI00195FB79B|nr:MULTISPECIES: ubiquinol-cytochrome C reductase [Erwiniaceae]MBM7342728.1 putative AAA+ superfamily ATPase [Pantoea coffeiphila]MCW1875997.1 ubiquinol-cytochrome C reductase [Erwinia sp. INIA01]
MTIYNDLRCAGFQDEDPHRLYEITNTANNAATNILIGVSAIGSLMFWSAENEDYSPEQAKEDMYSIGAMLMPLAEVVRALSDNAENARFAASEMPKGDQHGS